MKRTRWYDPTKKPPQEGVVYLVIDMYGDQYESKIVNEDGSFECYDPQEDCWFECKFYRPTGKS